MVVAQPDPAAAYTVTDDGDTLRFATAAVTIAIDKRTAAFTYLDSQR